MGSVSQAQRVSHDLVVFEDSQAFGQPPTRKLDSLLYFHLAPRLWSSLHGFGYDFLGLRSELFAMQAVDGADLIGRQLELRFARFHRHQLSGLHAAGEPKLRQPGVDELVPWTLRVQVLFREP